MKEMEEYFEYCRNKILAEMYREAEIDCLESIGYYEVIEE